MAISRDLLKKVNKSLSKKRYNEARRTISKESKQAEEISKKLYSKSGGGSKKKGEQAQQTQSLENDPGLNQQQKTFIQDTKGMKAGQILQRYNIYGYTDSKGRRGVTLKETPQYKRLERERAISSYEAKLAAQKDKTPFELRTDMLINAEARSQERMSRIGDVSNLITQSKPTFRGGSLMLVPPSNPVALENRNWGARFGTNVLTSVMSAPVGVGVSSYFAGQKLASFAEAQGTRGAAQKIPGELLRSVKPTLKQTFPNPLTAEGASHYTTIGVFAVVGGGRPGESNPLKTVVDKGRSAWKENTLNAKYYGKLTTDVKPTELSKTFDVSIIGREVELTGGSVRTPGGDVAGLRVSYGKPERVSPNQVALKSDFYEVSFRGERTTKSGELYRGETTGGSTKTYNDYPSVKPIEFKTVEPVSSSFIMGKSDLSYIMSAERGFGVMKSSSVQSGVFETTSVKASISEFKFSDSRAVVKSKQAKSNTNFYDVSPQQIGGFTPQIGYKPMLTYDVFRGLRETTFVILKRTDKVGVGRSKKILKIDDIIVKPKDVGVSSGGGSAQQVLVMPEVLLKTDLKLENSLASPKQKYKQESELKLESKKASKQKQESELQLYQRSSAGEVSATAQLSGFKFMPMVSFANAMRSGAKQRSSVSLNQAQDISISQVSGQVSGVGLGIKQVQGQGQGVSESSLSGISGFAGQKYKFSDVADLTGKRGRGSLKFDLNLDEGRKGLFTSQVRVRGRFVTLQKGLDLPSAIKLGKRYTATKEAASFRVLSPQGSAVRLNLGSPQYYGSRREKGVYIEKTSFRINTPGEIRGISAKGWLTNRRGGSIL